MDRYLVIAAFAVASFGLVGCAADGTSAERTSDLQQEVGSLDDGATMGVAEIDQDFVRPSPPFSKLKGRVAVEQLQENQVDLRSGSLLESSVKTGPDPSATLAGHDD